MDHPRTTTMGAWKEFQGCSLEALHIWTQYHGLSLTEANLLLMFLRPTARKRVQPWAPIWHCLLRREVQPLGKSWQHWIPSTSNKGCDFSWLEKEHVLDVLDIGLLFPTLWPQPPKWSILDHNDVIHLPIWSPHHSESHQGIHIRKVNVCGPWDNWVHHHCHKLGHPEAATLTKNRLSGRWHSWGSQFRDDIPQG